MSDVPSLARPTGEVWWYGPVPCIGRDEAGLWWVNDGGPAGADHPAGPYRDEGAARDILRLVEYLRRAWS